MDYLQRLINQARTRLFLIVFFNNALLIGLWWVGSRLLSLSDLVLGISSVVLALVITVTTSLALASNLMEPLKAIWQAVMHLSPDNNSTKAPDVNQLGFGKEVVANLTSQIYQLITVADSVKADNAQKVKDLSNNFVAQNLPLPLFVLDSEETIKFANQAAASYIGIPINDLIGKNVYMVMDMSFTNEDTFDTWLKAAKTSSATSTGSWERVRLAVRDDHPMLLFDLAAYYNRDNPDQNQTIMVLFDHTKSYSQDDQAISFVALAVHELRAPLTLLRGYIEVLEEELEGKVEPELNAFMEKMHAQAEQMMAFVNNILNVARVDDDQLELKLGEGNWPSILKSSIESLSIRAKVQGIQIKGHIEANLPTVAVDSLSIKEVINNLVDNAMKYSNKSKLINIETHLNKDGMVETTVQDYGRGISSAVLPNLFTKFYRDHNNRSQVGGTGLGLYLSKAIVKAHGGNMWVNSQPDKGSTFGFTLLPYSKLGKEAQENSQSELVRSAHGWIKNHSLYRR